MKIPQTYQEVEVWFIIPVIRAELAKSMIKQGLKQKEAADLIGLTEAAVSNYIKGKRAKSKIKLDDKILKEIEKSAKKLTDNKSTLTEEIQKITDFIKRTGLVCALHKTYNKSIKKTCNICRCKK